VMQATRTLGAPRPEYDQKYADTGESEQHADRYARWIHGENRRGRVEQCEADEKRSDNQPGQVVGAQSGSRRVCSRLSHVVNVSCGGDPR
jgi:hypothetical protein